MGSLYDLLLDYVDTCRAHDSSYDVACILLAHYSELPNLSQREMADLCFTSQASFSRFCRFLGFENFAEFKEAVDSSHYRIDDDYTRAFARELLDDDRSALGTYRSSLAAVMESALTEVDLDAVPALLDALDQADRVVFLSHHFLWHIGRYLQGKLLPLGRFVELPQAYEHQLEAAKTIKAGDLAIICSINGTYFSHYQDIVQAIFSSRAKVAAITQNQHALYLNRVDYVLGCGNTNENDVGKYAALMTIDYLVMSYIKKTQSK